MRTICFDCETFLVTQGNRAPTVVCGSWAMRKKGELVAGLRHAVARLDPICSFLDWYDERIRDPEIIWVGHRVNYDFAVCANERPDTLPFVFKAYEEGRVRDTRIRQKLLDLSRGAMLQGREGGEWYSLGNLAKLAGYKRHSAKNSEDAWTKRYAEVYPVHLSKWPREARVYPVDDTKGTLSVFEWQRGQAEDLDRVDEDAARRFRSDYAAPVVDEIRQVRKEFALHLASVWGVRIDGKHWEMKYKELSKKERKAMRRISEAGLVRTKKTKHRDGTETVKETRNLNAIRDLIEEACEQRGVEPLRSDPSARYPEGQTKYGKEAIEHAARGIENPNPLLQALVDQSKAEHYKRYLEGMKPGIKHALGPRYESLLETGRVSAFDPEAQQWPKDGGIRECIVPRKGRLIGSADFSQLELVTHSQNCLELVGESAMAEAIQHGKDLHVNTGAGLASMAKHKTITYKQLKALVDAGDEEAKELRQRAKAVNFGFPGGMQPKGFRTYALNTYKVDFSERESEEAYDLWLNTYPENREYFRMIRKLLNREGKCDVEQLISGRIRGDCYFTQAANTLFQGRAADGAGDACYEVQKRCWVRTPCSKCNGKKGRSSCEICGGLGYSPLFGSRLVLFIHDELVIETADDYAEHAALATDELARVMVTTMQRWCPDVPVKAEPVLMRRWSKAAKTVRDANGMLRVWEPKPEGAKGGKAA